MDTVVNTLREMDAELAILANAQFESAPYKKILSMKLTQERVQVYILQRAYFHLNRRDCWAYVQAAAPFDVKKLIWDHEREELAGDPERGIPDHYTLGIQEGATVALEPGALQPTGLRQWTAQLLEDSSADLMAVYSEDLTSGEWTVGRLELE